MVVSLGLSLDACFRNFLASVVLFSIRLATPILKVLDPVNPRDFKHPFIWIKTLEDLDIANIMDTESNLLVLALKMIDKKRMQVLSACYNEPALFNTQAIVYKRLGEERIGLRPIN